MKILFLAPASSIHTIRWINALVKRNNQVLLVSLPNHILKNEEIDDKVQLTYLPFGKMKGYYLNSFFLKKIWGDFKPDIVNAHYASGYGTLARISKIPHLILSVWGSDVFDFPYRSKINFKIMKKNLLYAEKIASTSITMGEQVEKLIGKKQITITPFGVDLKTFKNFNDKNDDRFSFGIIKTLLPIYGIDILLIAFAKFLILLKEEKKYDKKIALEIYGEGESYAELKKLAQDLSIDKQVFFRGHISNNEVPAALNRLDVFCATSICNESFGVSIVEAMACEIPVIVSDVDGFKEIVEDKISGIIVARGKPDELAKAMFLMYEDKYLRTVLGKNGRKKVEAYYDWNKNVETMLALYKEATDWSRK